MSTPTTTSAPINKKVGFINAFIAATLMGFVGFFARHINAQGDFIASSRMMCGTIAFFAILAYKGRLHELKSYKLSFPMILSGFFMGNCLSAYVMATKLTSIANAVFFIYIGPIISTLLAVIFLKEKMRVSTWVSMAGVFIGMLLIVGLVSFEGGSLKFGFEFKAETFKGDMLALYSGVGYGLFLFFNRFRTEVPGDTRAFWNFLFALLGILALFPITQPTIAQMGSSDWIWWIAIGFVCGFGALGTCSIATRHLKASEFACVSYWECVVAPVFVGLLIFGEAMSMPQIIGGSLIIIGGMSEVVVSLLSRKGSNETNDGSAPPCSSSLKT
ncbi:DMT family transporter [Kingella negevensis]|uniref:EamA-like transporter family protein n=1 Tax=Kingella negevensis TaxID=1522312 RepID=A0A238HIN5_9NEIS|nr:DMT family transporter [Kingella negevensis]SNB78300.1 EamA-like transporter family protein [Kingella negevensis]